MTKFQGGRYLAHGADKSRIGAYFEVVDGVTVVCGAYHYCLKFAFESRATSRGGGKEGREPDRNVLMYLRTGSAGPTPHPPRIGARR